MNFEMNVSSLTRGRNVERVNVVQPMIERQLEREGRLTFLLGITDPGVVRWERRSGGGFSH